MNPHFQSQILLDIGISTGDEGKGRLIPELVYELARQSGSPGRVGLVLKVNGGANSGHTVGGLKLNLIPAGAICADVGCLALGAGVVADPRKLLWETDYVEVHGHSLRPRLRVDDRTMLSDLSHRLLDLAWEYYRSEVQQEEKRGSTGRGITPAFADETGQFQIYYQDLRLGRAEFARRLRARWQRALATIQHVCRVPETVWRSFFDTLSEAEARVAANKDILAAGKVSAEAFDFRRFCGTAPFTLQEDLLEETYWQAGQAVLPLVTDVRELVLDCLRRGEYIIGEFGQAFWLDKRHGFPPNVTASHCLPPEFFLSAGIPLQTVHTFGVCKAYDTKVGTHAFPCRMPAEHPLAQKLSQLEFGVATGRQRMVGWYDAIEKGDALRYAGSDDLLINKLDALSYSGDWQGGELLICVGYRAADGTLLRHVPRQFEVHRSVQPVYRQLPGWSEDLSEVRTFDNLPLNAKRYLATAFLETLRVAYGEPAAWPARVPNLRFVGVGPEPDQLVRGIPPARELIKLAL